MTVNYLVTRKLRTFFRLISFIQKRTLCRYHSREAKIEILINYWKKFTWRLKVRNLVVKDSLTDKFLHECITVNEEVRRHALEEYLRCATRVHTIAFLQWRNKFPSKIRHNYYMLKDLIEERVTFMYGDIQNARIKYKPSDRFNG